MVHFLFWCANEHVDFRAFELEALASKFKIKFKWIEKPIEDPYFILELDNEDDAQKLVSRSVLIRSCYELWGSGFTHKAMHDDVKTKIETINQYFTAENSFKINVTTFNKKINRCEKLEKIESFSYLPFEGQVDLQNPKVVLHLIDFHGLSPINIPDQPLKSFFGRWISDGQRDLVHLFSLKTRSFIGSTSMDAKLAFLMANIAQVGPGSITVDPFVGTGSILVSAAHRGSFVWGWDIDFLTLHAKSKPTRHSQTARQSSESIKNNLQQYGLGHKYLDVLVMDSSHLCWRKGGAGLIDAIITDPPYGIRESTEKVGSLKTKKYETFSDPSANATHEKLVHYPSKMNYNLADMFVDLLNFAALHLTLGGRLVCFVPVYREDYTEEVIPKHPCLRLESNAEQVLNTHSSRRLITLVKWREPLPNDCADATALAKSEEFRIKFFQASQNLTKDDRQKRKTDFPRDKRGQGLSYRLKKTAQEQRDSEEERPIEPVFNTVIEDDFVLTNS